ncbi:hypothetical protein QYF36_012038 [Acer negundo]|nr:hypothetical protein QYF36_012038 [Acer negundo]
MGVSGEESAKLGMVIEAKWNCRRLQGSVASSSSGFRRAAVVGEKAFTTTRDLVNFRGLVDFREIRDLAIS